MAVPFYVPDADEQQRINSGSSQSQSTTTSATQTPLQSPVSGEHLVQAFYEALYRYSSTVSGSPIFPTPPQSPSCSSASNMGYFVFPCATTANSSPRSSRIYIDGPYRESPRNSFAFSRSRLNSTGDDDNNDGADHHDHDDDDDETSDDDTDEHHQREMEYQSHDNSNNNDIIWQNEFEDHFISMTARERLQEFQGRIPPKKKQNANHTKIDKNRSEPKIAENKSKVKDQKFAWPTVVTAVVLAVGCGFFVTR